MLQWSPAPAGETTTEVTLGLAPADHASSYAFCSCDSFRQRSTSPARTSPVTGCG